MRTKRFFLALVLASFWLAGPSIAQERSYDIMVQEGGKAAKKKAPSKAPLEQAPSEKTTPKPRPRGSSYVPNLTLPRSQPVVVAPPSPGVYQPPPINSFSDRVNNCNHSFPLNAGIGNNPTERSAYVRQCAN